MAAKASQKKMDYIASYEADNYDRVLVRLPKGTKARIQATGQSVNGFTVAAVLNALNSTQAPPDHTTPDE